MNLAFPALLVFLLVLPGIIFRYTYGRGSWGWASPTSFRNVSDELAYGAIFAVGLHSLWVFVVRAGGNDVDFRSLLAMLLGNFGHQSIYFERAIASVADHTKGIAVYFVSLYAFAAVAGNISHRLVRRFKLDRKTRALRFKNEWYYLLTGEVLDFAEVKEAPGSREARDVDGVYLSAVVDHGKESFLYRGIVQDFSFDAEGNLGTITLTLAHRRLLSADRPDAEPAPTGLGANVVPDERYYPIRGDFFLLRYSEIKTLNVDYFSVTPEVPIEPPRP